MIPLVQLRRNSFWTKLGEFFYTVTMVFAILLSGTFYVMNSMEDISLPTQEIQPTSTVNIVPKEEKSEKNAVSTEVNPPSLATYEKIVQAKLQNKDTIGWLKIPNTNIDYPVVQYEDNEYYLRRGFDGRYKFAGTLYADYRVVGNNRKELNRNIIIYGHNINQNHQVITGEMFAQLMSFKDFEFARENQYIYYSTEEDEMIWEIFSVFYNGEDREGNPDLYHIEIDGFNDDYTYEEYLDEIILRSEYNYGVEVGEDDKLITLSTCSYKYGLDFQQYLVVVAKLVPQNEDKEKSNVEINQEKKQAQFLIDRGQ